MKTLLLILSSLVIGFSSASAQTEKGRWLVGVSIGSITYQDNNTAKTFTGNLAPLAGYFVADNLLIGAGVPLSLSTSKPGLSNPYLVKSVTTGVGVSPLIRYYVGKSAFKPYVGMSYSYSYMHYTYKRLPALGSDVADNGYSTSYIPTIGAAYFINRNMAVNASLNYTILKTKTAYFSPISSTSLGIINIESTYNILSFEVGFQIFLGQ